MKGRGFPGLRWANRTSSGSQFAPQKLRMTLQKMASAPSSIWSTALMPGCTDGIAERRHVAGYVQVHDLATVVEVYVRSEPAERRLKVRGVPRKHTDEAE